MIDVSHHTVTTMKSFKTIAGFILTIFCFLFQRGNAVCTGYYRGRYVIQISRVSDDLCASHITCNFNGTRVTVRWSNPKTIAYVDKFFALMLCKGSEKLRNITRKLNFSPHKLYKFTRLCALNDSAIYVTISAIPNKGDWISYDTMEVCRKEYNQTETSIMEREHNYTTTALPQIDRLDGYNPDGKEKKQYLLVLIYVFGGVNVILIVSLIKMEANNKNRRHNNRCQTRNREQRENGIPE